MIIERILIMLMLFGIFAMFCLPFAIAYDMYKSHKQFKKWAKKDRRLSKDYTTAMMDNNYDRAMSILQIQKENDRLLKMV